VRAGVRVGDAGQAICVVVAVWTVPIILQQLGGQDVGYATTEENAL
jgi:hypothetical protein